jgi:hypothetical protein
MIASITRSGWLSYRAPPRELSDARATAGQDVNGELVGQRHVRREDLRQSPKASLGSNGQLSINMAIRSTRRMLRPCVPRRYSRPRGWSRLWLVPSRHQRDETQVLTFHTKAWSSFAPPICRMSLGLYQASPKLIPEEGSPPGFDIV